MASMSEHYFDDPPPPSLTSHISRAKAFIEAHLGDHTRPCQRLVLVTSGGTTVPLERQTVRFINSVRLTRKISH